MWSTVNWSPTPPRTPPAPRTGGPGRAHGGDSSLQRGQPNPDGWLFGQATSRTRTHHATATFPAAGHHPDHQALDTGGGPCAWAAGFAVKLVWAVCRLRRKAFVAAASSGERGRWEKELQK